MTCGVPGRPGGLSLRVEIGLNRVKIKTPIRLSVTSITRVAVRLRVTTAHRITRLLSARSHKRSFRREPGLPTVHGVSGTHQEDLRAVHTVVKYARRGP